LHTRLRRRGVTVAALLLALTLLPTPGSASPDGTPDQRRCPPGLAAQPSDTVNDPTVIGPIGNEGIRTRQPYGTTMLPLPEGWIEQEFFFEGTARTYGDDTVETTPYRSRILVRRPTDPHVFNGTVVLDWNNVTIPHDRDVAWAPIHATLLERGYAYVSVAAQRLGVEISPIGLKQYDPVRYGGLNHPGDDWSFDIFSQGAEAVLDDKVIGDLRPCVQRRVGMGASQSAGRLKTYINTVQEQAGVFDGFTPQISSAAGVRRDLVPIIWVNSTAEANSAIPADSELFRLWELAGAAHTSHQSSSYQDQMLTYSHTNGNAGKWDAEEAGAWGYQARPGDCLTRNYFQAGYAWSAALVTLDEWIRTGKAPAPQPRVEFADGARVFDEHGHVKGGIRSPLVDVPIASYFAGIAPPPGADPCGQVGGRVVLSGFTRVFDAATLEALYPTPQDYLAKFDAAVDAALAAGQLLVEGAEQLRRRALEAAKFIAAATG
jgi:hypothetical protein